MSDRDPPPPARSPAPVDLGMLRNLRAAQGAGQPDIVAEVVAIFLQDAPGRVATIRAGVARGDLEGASRAAHTLKGSAGHLGARTLSTLCARFEEKVREGSPFDASSAADAIAEELARVREALGEETKG
jgi:HPt (histidine-containing phosphotransfer) domain-containing protein